MSRVTLEHVNAMSAEEFERIFGGVFEHSPWIADEAFAAQPFANIEELHHAMCSVVKHAPAEMQLALINAHPDLVGKLALAGSLTPESNREQASAGLDKLSPEEVKAFQDNNAAYRARFGFPFIICARLNKKEAILNGFKTRLNNSKESEMQTALGEIFKIAELRLRDLISQ